eukprot:5944426-Amphidinium_carterae.1
MESTWFRLLHDACAEKFGYNKNMFASAYFFRKTLGAWAPLQKRQFPFSFKTVSQVLQPAAGNSFKFFTDALTSSCPNLPQTGAGLATFDWLTDGRVNLEPLLHSAGRLSVKFAATWQGSAHVGLTDLLLKLQSAGKQFYWLLTQLFYKLGAIFAAYLEFAT